MQKEFTENMSKLWQSMSKPMMELTELNINTLNHLTKNAGSFEELSQVKKPEDFMAAQVKLVNAACLEATRYSQKAMEIGIEAISDASKIWTDSLNKATCKASEFVKTSTNPKGRE